MEYVAMIFVFFGSSVLAYLITKKRIAFWCKVLSNVFFLLVSGALMLITGVRETTLLIYALLFPITLLGILTRIFTPLVLNLIGNILSKIQNQVYEKQNYEQIMQDGHRMFFCVLLFTTLKVLLYVALLLSVLKVI